MFGLEHLPADQLEYQKQYFNILMFGGIINLVRNAAPCFFSGIGETKIVMKAAFVGMIVNVVCNYFLIYGLRNVDWKPCFDRHLVRQVLWKVLQFALCDSLFVCV